MNADRNEAELPEVEARHGGPRGSKDVKMRTRQTWAGQNWETRGSACVGRLCAAEAFMNSAILMNTINRNQYIQDRFKISANIRDCCERYQ